MPERKYESEVGFQVAGGSEPFQTFNDDVATGLNASIYTRNSYATLPTNMRV